MGILLVMVEEKERLSLNEFFDYNGHCYGSSIVADGADKKAVELTDFYEYDAKEDRVYNVPVFFGQRQNNQLLIFGWYEKATVYESWQNPSLFLSGNIVADATNVVYLKEAMRMENIPLGAGRDYEVLEEEDYRYERFVRLLQSGSYENALQRYPFVHIEMEPKAKKNYELCIEYCQMFAERIMSDGCQGLAEIKALCLYAEQGTKLQKDSEDAYYYLAMGNYQLGFVKEARKAIDRALALEKEKYQKNSSDLLAMKANIMCSMKHYQEGARLFHLAYEKEAAEELESEQIGISKEYRFWEGRALMLEGKMDLAYQCFSEIGDRAFLEDNGIQLKEMDKKWSFSRIFRAYKNKR